MAGVVESLSDNNNDIMCGRALCRLLRSFSGGDGAGAGAGAGAGVGAGVGAGDGSLNPPKNAGIVVKLLTVFALPPLKGNVI